ncbi:MAG: membrane protein [Parvibaculum sp.]|uniref:hemolysin family protein n=1 Tax=Parvibaculum sp. TaxID=2024848 RepID=UPI0035BB8A70
MSVTLLILQLMFVPLLIGINAFFVAAEYAVVTLRSTRIEELRREGVAVARVLSRLKDDMSGSIATIQVCITATNLLIGAVAEPAMTQIIRLILAPLGAYMPETAGRVLGLVVGFTLVTLLTVVLSELLPKALTLQHTERIGMIVARPIAFFRLVCSPLVSVMSWMGNAVTRTFGLGDVEIEEAAHTEEELEMLVDKADEAGEFHHEHGDILRRAFDFADLKVVHTMIPMRKVQVLDANATVNEAVGQLQEWPYTRWPLRDPSTGKIVGILNIKLAIHAIALQLGDVLILRDLASPPAALDPDMPLVDALTYMRKSRRHIVMVAEGNGPELGIVTLEDILEAIVGDIPSEAQRPDTPRPPRTKERVAFRKWRTR